MAAVEKYVLPRAALAGIDVHLLQGPLVEVLGGLVGGHAQLLPQHLGQLVVGLNGLAVSTGLLVKAHQQA